MRNTLPAVAETRRSLTPVSVPTRSADTERRWSMRRETRGEKAWWQNGGTRKTGTGEDKTETYLHVTFCDVQRRNAGVGETARKSTTQHALGVVANIVGDGAKIPEEQRVSRVISVR